MNHLPDKALSIRQPWVWAILNAGKRIENRPRRYHYRGPICLHASSTLRSIEFMESCQSIKAITASKAATPTLKSAREWLNFGGIVGTAEIVDCIETSDDPWFFGPYGLVLENVQPVEFIPVKGALGLFNWKERL